MDYSAVSTLLIGYAAQWAKAHKKVPTVLVQLACMGATFGLYAIEFHYSAANSSWLVNGVSRAMAAVGAASFSAASGIAPKTDSFGGQ
jgi:hypothetical protein